MTAYKAPLDDLRFTLFDVLDAEPTLTSLQGGENHGRDLLDAVLEEAGRLSEQLLAPTNAPGDLHGGRRGPVGVSAPPGLRAACRSVVDGGRGALACLPSVAA